MNDSKLIKQKRMVERNDSGEARVQGEGRRNDHLGDTTLTSFKRGALCGYVTNSPNTIANARQRASKYRANAQQHLARNNRASGQQGRQDHP
jgi:hypothetical protein